jgi:hypothetical protein
MSENKLEGFASTRKGGAQKITDDSKKKGGLALLTWHHFKVKLPYYKKAEDGTFDVEAAKKEYEETFKKISLNMTQVEFQREVGRLEVLGELIIKSKNGNLKKVNEEIVKSGDKWKVFPKKPASGEKKRKALGTHSTKEKAVAQLRAIEISKNENYLVMFDDWVNENKSSHPTQYKAPEGSSRDKKLDKAKKLLVSGKKKEAYRLRDSMEKKEREKPDWKNTPRKDSKVNEAKKKETLSKETQDKIRKVAQKKGYSYSDLVQEYKKGLGAYYSSGSRPGMTAHQWAMARVNAASPSKSWANVKSTKK